MLRGVSFDVEPGKRPRWSAPPAPASRRSSSSCPAWSTSRVGSARRRGRRARADLRSLWSHIGMVPAASLPVQRQCGVQQPALRRPRGHRRRDVGRPEGGPAETSCGPCPTGWSLVAQGGRTSAADSASVSAIARALVSKTRGLPLRRRVLGPRPGHRRTGCSRPATRTREASHHRRPAHVDDHRRRSDRRARRRPRRRHWSHDERARDVPDIRRDRREPQAQRRRREPNRKTAGERAPSSRPGRRPPAVRRAPPGAIGVTPRSRSTSSCRSSGCCSSRLSASACAPSSRSPWAA